MGANATREGGVATGVAGRRRRATRIPAAMSAPPASSTGVERLAEQDDGDRGGEERLQVRGERRARGPDPVERAEPEHRS